MAVRAAIVGLAGIDKAIRSLAGVLESGQVRVQEIAVAIVDHAANAGNGDVSRALTLAQTVKRYPSMNVGFLTAWFAAFAGTNINLNKGTVGLFSKDSKKQRGFRVEEAKANNWFDAFDEKGERAPWYQGPDRPPFQPDTIGDLAEYLAKQAKRLRERLDDTKEVNGKKVPLVTLNKKDRQNFETALDMIETISAQLARHEAVTAAANDTDEVEQQEEAVA